MFKLFTPEEFEEFIIPYKNCSSAALRRIYQNTVLDSIEELRKTERPVQMYIASKLYSGTLKWDIRYFKSFKSFNSKWWYIARYWAYLTYKISKWYYGLLLIYLDKNLGDDGKICSKLDALMTIFVSRMLTEIDLPYSNQYYNYTNGKVIDHETNRNS